MQMSFANWRRWSTPRVTKRTLRSCCFELTRTVATALLFQTVWQRCARTLCTYKNSTSSSCNSSNSNSSSSSCTYINSSSTSSERCCRSRLFRVVVGLTRRHARVFSYTLFCIDSRGRRTVDGIWRRIFQLLEPSRHLCILSSQFLQFTVAHGTPSRCSLDLPTVALRFSSISLAVDCCAAEIMQQTTGGIPRPLSGGVAFCVASKPTAASVVSGAGTTATAVSCCWIRRETS